MRLPFIGRIGWTTLFAAVLLLPLSSMALQRGRRPNNVVQIDLEGSTQTRRYDFTEANKQQEYELYVPPKYKPANKTPLVVALHGLGGTPRQFLGTRGFTDLAKKHGYIVVAPYGYNEHGGYGIPGRGGALAFSGTPDDPPNIRELSEKDVMNVLAIVRKDFNIDPDRIYLMGHSMGGGGTWFIAMKYPEIWAALGPIAPAAPPSPPPGLDKLKGIPVIVVQGDKDNSVPVAGTRQWVGRMKSLGMTYSYIEVKGGTHGSVVGSNLSKVFDFFDKHPRRAAK